MDCDLAIVGSGAAGFAAAIAARRRGLVVVMVEQGVPGGTCVNVGCVPSKALLAAVGSLTAGPARGRFPGVGGAIGSVDFAELVAGKDLLVGELRAEKYIGLAAELGWEIIEGRARFESGPRLWVEGADVRVRAEHYLVATGSVPRIPAVVGVDEVASLTSATAMELGELPGSLLVVGGGYVGLEQAQLFARLGVEVTVVEARGRVVAGEEPEVSAAIERVLVEEGVAVRTGVEVRRMWSDAGHVVAVVDDGSGVEGEVRAQRVLFAAGRRPASGAMGLAEIGVALGPAGEVVVDGYLRTSAPRVWAAGDVTGHPAFVYVAASEGALAVDNAFGPDQKEVDFWGLPRVMFTSPSVASAGLTEEQAAAQGVECESRVLPLDMVPRAIVNRDTRGLVKLVAERGSGRLVGAHVVAEGAGEVVAAAGYALRSGMTVADVAGMWCPYLTMAEGLKLAAQMFDRDVSRLSCCSP